MPKLDQVGCDQPGAQPRRLQAQRGIDVVQRAEHRARRIDRPMRRPEPLHPAALLVDQDRRIGLAERLPQFPNKLSDLSRRFDIPLE